MTQFATASVTVVYVAAMPEVSAPIPGSDQMFLRSENICYGVG